MLLLSQLENLATLWDTVLQRGAVLEYVGKWCDG